MPSYPAGTPDRIPHWVRLLDHVLALTIACPLVSLLWCGGFFLTDTYIYPNDKPFGYWLIFIVGSMLSLNVHIHCDSLIAISARCPDSAQLLQRLIGIVLIVTIVFQWDGLWCLLDYYLGHTQISCFYCWALGTVVLCLTGCRNNMVTGVPFMCRHDRAELLFAATTRFHAKSYGSRLWSFCDQLFSIFVVQPSVILIWRGLWNIQDYTLLPKDPVKSANISCLAGWILTILNMGGLSTQLGAVPDPPLDIRTDVIRFPIDYVAQIYKTHVQYTALIKQQQQQQPGQRLSTSPLSKPLLKTNRGTAKALYPLLDEIQLPLPDSLPS
ncbi:uncharacterized protein LOC111254876 isoform X7 [Varroa destructor]|uniref:Transmembrane protein n=1 Tax=Varroa destructor TaxID=109461 RepID=A0A7M7L701_VARDE|nr:uncharacterized protein LOC111254876 isoform X7 [Varroa destructor]